METSVPALLAAWDGEIEAQLRALEDQRPELAAAIVAAEEAQGTAKDFLHAVQAAFAGNPPEVLRQQLDELAGQVKAAERETLVKRWELERADRQIRELSQALDAVAQAHRKVTGEDTGGSAGNVTALPSRERLRRGAEPAGAVA